MAIRGAPADWVREPSKGSDREGFNRATRQHGLGEHKATTVARGEVRTGPGAGYREGRAAHRMEVGNRPSATPDNPDVISKTVRRNGKDGSRLHFGTDLTSTGNQPADSPSAREREAVPPMGNLHEIVRKQQRGRA